MKKGFVSLALALVLALGLCAGAAAAPAENAADGAIAVSGLTGGQYAFVAGYDETGRFLGARVLTADGATQPIPGAAEVRVFRTDGLLAPQGEAVSLSRDCRVRKADGQVELYYAGPDGVTVTQPVTRKVTGRVSGFGKLGSLYINGQAHYATDLAVEGCAYAISEEDFQYQQWLNQPGVPAGDTLDFYLDPWGNICWIDLVAEYVYPVRTNLLLSAGVTGTPDGGAAVRAELLYSDGSVETVDVSSLDGQPITDPDAAVARLSAHAPGGFYACQRQRGGGFAMTTTENTPGNGWGQTLTIPPDTVTAPDADFTGSKVNCLANDETIFALSRGLPGEEGVTRWVGYRDLPAVTVLQGTVVTAEGDPAVTPVARFVYLRTLDVEPPPPVEPPEGYVFLADNRMTADPDLARDDVYRVNIIDADGARTDMRVSGGLGLGISYDSMEVGRFADNFYLGKFCAVTGIDKNDVVTALKPVEASEVSAFGDGLLETSAGSWGYDDNTRCVYVDLYWDDMNGNGVRDDADQVTLADSNTFVPDSGFFDLNDVSADPASGASYRSAKAAVIPAADDPAVAAYIYLVREIW